MRHLALALATTGAITASICFGVAPAATADPGTVVAVESLSPAATLPEQVPPEVVADRYERLVTLVDDVAWSENKRQVGRRLEVMVAEGEGRKDAATHRLSGRARDGRLVHFTPGDAAVRPGDVVTVGVTYGAPHHLVADGPLLSHRRTRAGALFEERGHEAGLRGGAPTTLGLPGFGAPSALPAVAGCATGGGAG